MDLSADGNVFGLDESLRPHARGPARAAHRGAVPVRRARHRRQGDAGDPRAAQAGDRRDQRRRRRHRRHDDAGDGHPAGLDQGPDRLRLRPARHRAGGRVELVPAAHRRAPAGAGVGVLRRHPHRRAGARGPAACARCTSPTSCSAPRSDLARSFVVRPLAGGARAGQAAALPQRAPPTTRSRRTGPTAWRCGTPASATARRASRPSWRSATRSSRGRPRDIPDVF